MEAPQDRPKGLESLPDDVLVQAFSGLSLQERHRAAPLVCRRLRAVAEDPRLNSNVDLTIQDSAAALPRLRSLHDWVRAGGAERPVRRLSLALPSSPSAADPEGGETISAVRTAGSLRGAGTAGGAVAGCRRLPHAVGMAAGAGGPAVPPAHWLGSWQEPGGPAAAHGRPGEDSAGLTCRPELQLDLHCREVLVMFLLESAQLPPSITWLHLCNEESELVPKQVAALNRLRSLGLTHTTYSSRSFDPLTGLTSLQRLSLANCKSLPECLPQLPWLQALHVHAEPSQIDYFAMDEGNGQLVRAALPQLACLTHLSLTSMHHMEQPPPELARLTALESFAWRRHAQSAAARLVELAPGWRWVDEPLPAGPWLAGLQRLEAPLDILAASLAELEAAAGLECLRAPHLGRVPALGIPALLRWAGRHPALRLLALNVPTQALGDVFSEAEDAVWRNPRLRLETSAGDDSNTPERGRDKCLGPF